MAYGNVGLFFVHLFPSQFLNLEDNTAQVNSMVDVDEPLFQPFPMNLSFEEYEPFATVEKLLFMRNNDNVARRIKIIPPDSEFFTVSPPKSAKKNQPLKNGKVAAGMEVCFTITFKPQEKREYNLDLVCCSEREKFVVPIKAVGNYAALNFPDEIDFGLCPVKKSTSKTMVVRNVGTKASKFLIKATAPYTVDTIPPVPTCPRDQHVTTYSPDGTTDVQWQPATATDNSGTATLHHQTHQPGQFFRVGTTYVKHTFVDPVGNRASCTHEITVEGKTYTIKQ